MGYQAGQTNIYLWWLPGADKYLLTVVASWDIKPGRQILTYGGCQLGYQAGRTNIDLRWLPAGISSQADKRGWPAGISSQADKY